MPEEINNNIKIITENIPDDIAAAAVSVISHQLMLESLSVKNLSRKAREPWRRSQHISQGITEYFDD